MTTSFPPINYPNKPVPPFTAEPPRNPFPGFFPDMWKNITGKPYITVSSKGLTNGQSEYFNDGADFGPDSLQADGSLTQTSGIQEAIDSQKKQEIIQLCPGNYVLNTSIIIESTTTIQGATGYTMNLGPVSESIDEYGPFECNILTGNFPAFTVSSPVGYTFLSLSGITISGTMQIADTDNIGFFCDSSVNSVTINVKNSRLTNLYDCAKFSGSYVIFTLESCLLDSFMNSSINQDKGELNILWSHINNASLASSANSESAIILGSSSSSIQKVQIFNSIIESVGNCFAIQSVQGNLQIIGCHIYSSGGTSYGIDAIGTVGEGFIMIGTTFYMSYANGTVNFSIDPGHVRIIGCYSNTGITQAVALTDTKFIGCNGSLDIPIAPAIPTNPPVSGTVYQNTNPYDIEIDLPVYATTAGTAGYVSIAKGATSTPTAIGNRFVSGSTSSTSTDIIKLRVPAGWYYSFTGSGVTFATATPFAE